MHFLIFCGILKYNGHYGLYINIIRVGHFALSAAETGSCFADENGLCPLRWKGRIPLYITSFM